MLVYESNAASWSRQGVGKVMEGNVSSFPSAGGVWVLK